MSAEVDGGNKLFSGSGYDYSEISSALYKGGANKGQQYAAYGAMYKAIGQIEKLTAALEKEKSRSLSYAVALADRVVSA